MRRHFLAGAFLFWAVMMCLVVRRHQDAVRSEGPAPLVALARRAPFAPVWYGLYRGPRKLGCAMVSADADAIGDAVVCRLSLEANVRLPEAVTARGEVVVRDPGTLEGFTVEVRSGLGGFVARGTVVGGELLCDYTLRVPSGSRGAGVPSRCVSQKARVPLAGLGGAGMEIRDMGEEAVNLAGVLTPGRRYLLATGAGAADVWIDASAGVLRAEFTGGFVAVREPRAIAERAGY